MRLGEKIKQLRIEKGMTQDDLAAATGTTKASISNYERNRRSPQYAIINSIADVLGIPLSELLTYAAAEGRNDAENMTAMNGIDDKRPVRVKRLLVAFERLSDDAQKKAVERVEELALIPTYRVSLPESMQRYIYSKYQQTYELPDGGDTESQEAYESDEGQDIEADIRHITLVRDKNGCRSEWHFYYYKFSDRPADSDVKEIVSGCGSYDNTQDKYSFVLDDLDSYNQFISCHMDIIAQAENNPHSDLMTAQAEITFFLINKDTWEIKDMESSDKYTSQPDDI